MAPKKLLLTSFDIWESHHITNSSDDLLGLLVGRSLLPDHTHLLRRIPVDFQLAPETVIQVAEAINPDVVICCGMAEKRDLLTVELNGTCADAVCTTGIDLDALIAPLTMTAISRDAGNFVCNHLYYSMLHYCQTNRIDCQCLFVHVPLLNDRNLPPILDDFTLILRTISEG